MFRRSCWTALVGGLTLTPALWGQVPAAPEPALSPIPEPAGPPAATVPQPAVPYQPAAPALLPQRTLAPTTQQWANQAYPAVTGAYPAYSTPGAGPGAGQGPFWAPGGYEARIGSPYYYHDPQGGQFSLTGNPYYDHWGPGFHRHSLHGHYRFPYYTYRAPWYYPGRAVYNRDTNRPW